MLNVHTILYYLFLCNCFFLFGKADHDAVGGAHDRCPLPREGARHLPVHMVARVERRRGEERVPFELDVHKVAAERGAQGVDVAALEAALALQFRPRTLHVGVAPKDEGGVPTRSGPERRTAGAGHAKGAGGDDPVAVAELADPVVPEAPGLAEGVHGDGVVPGVEDGDVEDAAERVDALGVPAVFGSTPPRPLYRPFPRCTGAVHRPDGGPVGGPGADLLEGEADHHLGPLTDPGLLVLGRRSQGARSRWTRTQRPARFGRHETRRVPAGDVHGGPVLVQVHLSPRVHLSELFVPSWPCALDPSP